MLHSRPVEAVLRAAGLLPADVLSLKALTCPAGVQCTASSTAQRHEKLPTLSFTKSKTSDGNSERSKALHAARPTSSSAAKRAARAIAVQAVSAAILIEVVFVASLASSIHAGEMCASGL